MTKLIHFALSLLLFLTNPASASNTDPLKSAVEKWNQASTFKKAMLELHQIYPTLLGDELVAAIPEQLRNQIHLRIDGGKVELSTKDKKFIVKAAPSRDAFMVNDQVVPVANRSAQQIFERILEITKGERHALNFSLVPEAQAQTIVVAPAMAYDGLRDCIDHLKHDSTVGGKIGSCAGNIVAMNLGLAILIVGDFITIGLVGVTGTVMAVKGGYGWLVENMPKSCLAHFEDLKNMKPNPNGYSLAGLSCHPTKLLLARKVEGKVETKTVEPKSSGLACDEHSCYKYRTSDRALLSAELDGKEIVGSNADLEQFVKMRTEWDLLSQAVSSYQKSGFCTCLKSAGKKTLVPVQTVESVK